MRNGRSLRFSERFRTGGYPSEVEELRRQSMGAPIGRRFQEARRSFGISSPCVINSPMDDDTLKQLLRINDELLELCRWLTDNGDREISSRLMPFVDELTHMLIEAGKNKQH
jgi:hypothetical protein